MRKRRVGAINNEREIRQKCDTRDRSMVWNLRNRCEECRTRESSENKNEENAEITNHVNVEIEESRVSEERNVRRQKCGEVEVKGGVTKMKDKEITRLFSVNCNVFGPGSNDKIVQVIRTGKR